MSVKKLIQKVYNGQPSRLGMSYTSYKYFNLETLEARRVSLCKTFGKKAALLTYIAYWFKKKY